MRKGFRTPSSQISGATSGCVDEGVVGRDAVGLVVGGRGCDPQHLAEQHLWILGVLVGSPEAAAVAEPDVQQPVRPDRERAAVVLHRLGVVDGEEHALQVGVGSARAVDGVGGQDVVVVGVGAVDVEPLAAGVVGEGEEPPVALLHRVVA